MGSRQWENGKRQKSKGKGRGQNRNSVMGKSLSRLRLGKYKVSWLLLTAQHKSKEGKYTLQVVAAIRNPELATRTKKLNNLQTK